MSAPVPASPYKGLAPFGDSQLDALLFFGRGRDVEIVTANLLASRLTVLYGPSGVGKSSLLRAGATQRLRALADENVGRSGRPGLVVVVHDAWSGDPVQGLVDAIAAAVAEVLPDVAPVAQQGSLADTARAWSERIGGELYLVLDQFEEYFTYHAGEDGPGSLAAELPELVRRRDVRAHVLLGVSEDAVGRLDVFRGRLPNLLGNSLRLDRLDREAARAAILGPVDEFNRLADETVTVEPELVDAVLDEVAAGRIDPGHGGRGGAAAAGGRIEAPYLQLVLGRLWEVERAAGSTTLRLATLHELGGAARIVEDHLERSLAALTAEQRDLAARVFNHLVTPSGTKIAYGAADLAEYTGAGPDELAPVLGALASARILRPLAPLDGAGGVRHEIFHDVLADAVLAWRTDHEAARALERQRSAADRRYRRVLGLAAAALVVALAMGAVAVFALTQRSHARAEAKRAHARELASDAVAQGATDPEQEVRLAAQAVRLEPSSGNEDVLRTALAGLHAEAVLPGGGGPVGTAAYSPDGSLVLTTSPQGRARLFDARTGVLARAIRDPHPVAGAAWRPDGAAFATADGDGLVRLWRAATGSPLRAYGRRGAPLTSVAFSNDGRSLVATAGDGTVRTWETATGLARPTIHEPGPTLGASFSPDGRRLVTFGRDRFARLYAVPASRLVARLAQRGRVTSASFSRRGNLVVTTSRDQTARIWGARTGRFRVQLTGHVGQVLDAAFSPDGKTVVTASTDDEARVWDAHTGVMTSELVGHVNYVTSVAFSPDGRFVVTTGADGVGKVWNLERLGLVTTLIGHGDTVTDAQFSPDGRSVVTASDDGTARLWNAQYAPGLRALGRHAGPVSRVAFSPDGTLVVSAGGNDARLWRADGGLVRTLRHGGPVTGFAFDRTGRLLLTASEDGTARIWPLGGGLPTVLTHGSPVVRAALGPDGRLAATAGADGSVRIWRVADGHRLATGRPGAGVTGLAFSPDGKLVVVAGADGRAAILRADGGAPLRTLAGHRGPVVAASFSPDGKLVLTAGKDGTARVFDAASGTLVHELLGHKAALTSASFSPDGRLVATTSLDHDTRVWDVASERTIRQVRDTAVVSDAAFSSDGRWLAIAGPGRAQLLEVGTGRVLATLDGRSRVLTSAAFSPAGWRIVTGGDDGTVRRYDCDLCAGTDGLLGVADRRLASLAKGQ